MLSNVPTQSFDDLICWDGVVTQKTELVKRPGNRLREVPARGSQNVGSNTLGVFLTSLLALEAWRGNLQTYEEVIRWPSNSSNSFESIRRRAVS